MTQPPAPPGPPTFAGTRPLTPPPPPATIPPKMDGPDWKEQWMKEAMIEAFVQVLRENMPSKKEMADAIRLGTKEAILEADD